MLNPYETARQTPGQPTTRRAARRYLIASWIVAGLGAIVALPGAVLLNQEWQLVPTYTELTHIEYSGRSISPTSIMRVSLILAACLLIIASMIAGVSFLTRRREQNGGDPAH